MKKLFNRVVRTALLAMCALMALPASAWEVCVASDGSENYTTYNVSQENGIYVSDPITFNKMDHFYLKNGNDKHTRLNDNWNIDSNTSSNKYSYLPKNSNQSKSDDLYWNADSKTIRICFSYTDDNPYDLYWEEVQNVAAVPTSLKIYGHVNGSSTDWDSTGKPMERSGNVFTINGIRICNEFKFNDGTSDYGPEKDEAAYKNISDFPYTADAKKVGYTWVVSDDTYNVIMDFTDAANPKMTISKATVMGTVAKPSISQNGNTISVACATEGATIYVCMNKVPELTEANKYNAPFDITANGTVYAIAVKTGMNNSETAELAVTYTAPVVTFTAGSALYFCPGTSWDTYSPSYKVEFIAPSGDKSGVLVPTYVEQSDKNHPIYKVTVPAGTWSHVDLLRYNSDGSAFWSKIYGIPAPADASNNIIYVYDDSGTGEVNNDKYKWAHYDEPGIVVPNDLYIVGDGITKETNDNWDATDAKQMTRMTDNVNENTFYYDFENYTGQKIYFRFIDKVGEAWNDWSMTNYTAKEDGVVMPEDVYSDFSFMTGGGVAWAFESKKNGTVRFEINFDTQKVRVYVMSNQVEDSEYYFIGDANKWLNDGTYHVDATDKDYSYGYDYKTHGSRDKWMFKTAPDGELNGEWAQGGGQWYKLVIPAESAIKSTLFGQFTIYKGEWSEKYDEKNVYYVPTWTNKEQYSSSEDIYTDAYRDSKIEAGKKFTAISTEKNANLHLAHNLYNNAVIYFNPTQKAIYIQCDDVKDIYVVYANSSANAGSKPVVKANAASINTKNYDLDLSKFNDKEMTPGTAEHANSLDGVTVNGEKFNINGLDYDRFWWYKLNPGMEFPAGQLVTLSLNNAPGVSADSWNAIKGENLYFLDGIHVFVEPKASEISVREVYYRVYDFDQDGADIVVFDKDGNAQKDAENGNYGWTLLNKCTLTNSSVIPTKHEISAENWSSEAGGHFSSYHTTADKCYEIAAANATKHIQFKIVYTPLIQETAKAPKREVGVEKTEFVPDSFLTDRSDKDASWVLNGTHKVFAPGIETGVEDIIGDEFDGEDMDVEPVYYNLQGQRVANPDKGIYIRVRGAKSDKVMF